MAEVLAYVNRHMKKHRPEVLKAIGYKGIGPLHEAEAEVEKELRWQLDILKAYLGHRRSYLVLPAAGRFLQDFGAEGARKLVRKLFGSLFLKIGRRHTEG